MNIALWIVAGFAAAAFVMAGAMKLVQGKKVEENGMAWAMHYSDSAIRGIGAAEVAGALGLILPAVTGIAMWLVPAAAIGLVDRDGWRGAPPRHGRRGRQGHRSAARCWASWRSSWPSAASGWRRSSDRLNT